MLIEQTASSLVSLNCEIDKVFKVLRLILSLHSPVSVVIVNDEETEAPVLVDPGQLVGGGRVLGLGDNLFVQ